MRKIPLTQAGAGMVLAQPVVNETGVTLAAVGSELTERLLRRFEKMEIEVVWIESDDPVDKALAEQMKKKIEARFARAGKSTLWQDLKELLLERVDQRVK
ncbi:MAG: hypothetical protein P9L99_06440 [Candidatus Lernaella stagnicola]|nr:hypothetical protein [Candidatus Lernaella stagnicola]